MALDERTDAPKAPAASLPSIGAPPDNRRQMLTKLCWTGAYMLYLYGVVQDLLYSDRHLPATVLGWAGFTAFVGLYITLVLMPRTPKRPNGGHLFCLAGLYVLAAAFSTGYDEQWLVLFVYASVAAGAVLPFRWSRVAVPGVTASMALVGLLADQAREMVTYISVPCLLGGAAMMGVQAMVHTMAELREARETVAHLAASDERLRLARDLHDLLGHSMSLITLKSELAGRMLPDQPQAAAKQVADIEQVSRQALKDVREAVSGYRRPKLAVEMAGVRTTLRTAQIDARCDSVLDRSRFPGLGPDEEGVLAWALREAVTNVVRHSGATSCEIALDEVWDEEGRFLALLVTDNGVGPVRSRPGNGLTGLRERLILSGGRLETGPGPRGKGFRMSAQVPFPRGAADEAAGAGPVGGGVRGARG